MFPFQDRSAQQLLNLKTQRLAEIKFVFSHQTVLKLMMQRSNAAMVKLLHICYQIWLIKKILPDTAQRLRGDTQIIGDVVKWYALKDFGVFVQ